MVGPEDQQNTTSNTAANPTRGLVSRTTEVVRNPADELTEIYQTLHEALATEVTEENRESRQAKITELEREWLNYAVRSK